MFSLNESCDIDRAIIKCDHIRHTHTLTSLATINEVNSQVFLIYREKIQ